MCKPVIYLQMARLKQRSDIAWQGGTETYSLWKRVDPRAALKPGVKKNS